MVLDIQQTANNLVHEHRNNTDFHTLPDIGDFAEAYQVQQAYVSKLPGGNDIAGYKIGMTSQRLMEMFGITHPLAGAILRNRVHPSGVHLDLRNYAHLGLEFELCARIGSNLPKRAKPYTRKEIDAAIDGVAPAIELVDDRHAVYAGLDCKTLVADNVWSAGAVIGKFVPPRPGLERITGVALAGEEEIGRGKGADVLGHPFEPVVWLANHLTEVGDGLKKGDLVMTGAIVGTQFPLEAFSFRFKIRGFGSVSVSGD